MSLNRTPRAQRADRPARLAARQHSAIESIDRAHRHTQQLLAQMLQLVDLLALPTPPPATATLAARICHHFKGPDRGHHENEETQVFPALLAAGSPALRDQVRRLQQDHMWLEEDWLELEPHLQAVAHGYTEAHHEFLRAALPEFTALCHEHMALEDALVHPKAAATQATNKPAAD